jgi:hypothetical protein
MGKTCFGQERKCRDVAMILIFLAAWGFSLWVGYNGLQHGDPLRLLNGYDFLGRTCGVDNCYDHVALCPCNSSRTCNLTQRKVCARMRARVVRARPRIYPYPQLRA